MVSEDYTLIYFVGIIDIFTPYEYALMSTRGSSMKKKLEHWCKLVRYGNKMSCIPPEPYAKRFIQAVWGLLKYFFLPRYPLA